MATPAQSVETLNNVLTDLENILDPLFEQTLRETMESHDKLQQAKLCAMLPYTINQLITIYLRTRGIDPAGHPVDGEIDRIKSYFHKIAKTDTGDTSNLERVSDQRLQLDKDAANRFITAALADASRAEKEELATLGISGPTMSSNENWVPRKREPHEQPPQIEGGIHTRFAHINDDNDKDSLNQDASDEEVLQVIGDEASEVRDHNLQATQAEQRKRKRSEFDPFTGYDQQHGKSDYVKRQKRPLLRHTESSDITNPPNSSEAPSGSSKQALKQKHSHKSDDPSSKNARKKAKRKGGSPGTGP